MTLANERQPASAPGCAPSQGVQHIGWREWIALPGLELGPMKSKVDTGARTSALHATDFKTFQKDGETWIEFRLPFEETNAVKSAPLLDERDIKNTSGVKDRRYVIVTDLVLGDRTWPIELSLADRENMSFEIILGRTAIRRRGLLVDPGRSFLAGQPSSNPLEP